MGHTMSYLKMRRNVRLVWLKVVRLRRVGKERLFKFKSFQKIPYDKLVASVSGDNTIRLWDAGSGTALQTLKRYSRWVDAVTFSLDSKLIASTSADNTVRLWDVGSGTALQTLESHSS
jgi:WD40 repeat protein